MNEQPKDADRFRNLLAFALIGAFVGVIPLFVYKSIPEANKDVITYMVGQLSGMALTALAFYFTNKAGQDALDVKKSDNTAKAFEAITATAGAATGSRDPNAIREGDEVTMEKKP
jgi:uncharacterized membrane protein